MRCSSKVKKGQSSSRRSDDAGHVVLGDDLLGGDTYETEHRERAPHVDDSVLAGAAALSFVKMRNAAMAGSNTVTTDEERETSQLLINGDH